MEVQAIFQTMGLRSEKAVAAYPFLENMQEGNLVSEMALVNYLAANRGRIHLRPQPALPAFVDDVYVFGYIPHA